MGMAEWRCCKSSKDSPAHSYEQRGTNNSFSSCLDEKLSLYKLQDPQETGLLDVPRYPGAGG